jgi:probable HAF family extracellular repeat protein
VGDHPRRYRHAFAASNRRPPPRECGRRRRARGAECGSPASADPPPAAAGNISHGFLFDRAVVTAIDHPQATTIPATPGALAGTATTGINDRGEILGAYEDRDRVIRHFVRTKKGRYIEIADPPGGSEADEYVDINNRREIVGFYNDAQGASTTGFLRSRKGRFESIHVPRSQVTGPLKVNDRGQVVGIYLDAEGGVHGFLWDDGEYETIDVRGAAATLVLGIDNRGQMVGSYIDAEGAYHGFLRHRSGRVRTLPEAPGADPTMGGTQPAAISDRGQIVGLAYDARGGSRGFMLRRGVLRSIDATPDAVFTRPLDIDERGRIVGDYATRPPAGARFSTIDSADLRGAGAVNPFGLTLGSLAGSP